ncbi:DNA primase [Thermosphaera chiliense]|uniref:DNA primase large subunit PriL n=1 Tax=Thermosphaera chiliense TaxID=3402707 RepID=A0A7M1UNI8_9CREN|nr:DNA primase [Thermosphaera aggregans]QOR93838.1 DNA primase [Thermosphaera aggregans]
MSGIPLYWKYPFLLRLEDVVPNSYTVLPVLIGNPDAPLYEKLLSYLKLIVEKTTVPQDRSSYNSDHEVIVFYSLGLVSKAIKEPQLLARTAVAYSKRAGFFFRSENDELLINVARKIGIGVIKSVQPPRLLRIVEEERGRKQFGWESLSYGITLTGFIRLVAGRLEQDSSYNLSSQIVHEGLVYVDRRRFTRLLEEACFHYILKTYEDLQPPSTEFLNGIEQLIAEVERYLENVKWWRRSFVKDRGVGEEVSGVVEEAFPPCIKKILSTIKSGGNPSHEERFNLAAFLVNIGYSVDDVLAVFRTTADFDEKIARYQVEHIAGLRGSRRKYTPYSCDRMKSVGACPIQNYCAGGRHPLSAYKHNLKLLKQSTEKSETGGPSSASETQ